MPARVAINGAELCVDTIGDPAHPAVLLIMGAAGSMDRWEQPFCERLVAAGRYVIRYDHRDTGGSTTYPPGKPGYTFDDLVADALGILDHLGVERAHLVGISMGGGIVQRIAVDHPERVLSVTLMSTSPAGPADRSSRTCRRCPTSCARSSARRGAGRAGLVRSRGGDCVPARGRAALCGVARRRRGGHARVARPRL